MTKDPWKKDVPQPGDFDAELDRARAEQIETHDGNPDAELSLLVRVEGDDARRLERMAEERGRRPDEVVSELLRDAP
jgi:hypothetical protein